MTSLNRNWLICWSIFIGVFGLVLFGAGWASSDDVARALFALTGNPLPDLPDRYLRFAISLMGAVTFGWATTLYALFRAAWAMPTGSAAVWRFTTLGIVAWYVIDSAASIANGFAMNAASNTLVLALFLVPVVQSGAMRDA